MIWYLPVLDWTFEVFVILLWLPYNDENESSFFFLFLGLLIMILKKKIYPTEVISQHLQFLHLSQCSYKSWTCTHNIQLSFNLHQTISVCNVRAKNLTVFSILSTCDLFPNKPFTCLLYMSIENTVGNGEIAGKEQFLIYPVFYPIGELSTNFIKFVIVVCKLFEFGRV